MSDSARDQGTRMLGAGMTLVVTVGVFAYGGHLVDSWLETSPLFLLVGVLLGATGGFIHLFSVVAPGMLPFGRSRAGGPKRTGGAEPRSSDAEKDPGDLEPPSSPPKP